MKRWPTLFVLVILIVVAGSAGVYWVRNLPRITPIRAAEISYAIPGEWKAEVGLSVADDGNVCDPTLRHLNPLDDLGLNIVMTTVQPMSHGQSLERLAREELAHEMSMQSASATMSGGSLSAFSSDHGVSGFNVRYNYFLNDGCVRERFVNSNYFFLNAAGQVVRVRYTAEIFQPEVDAALGKSLSLR
jgi:hypothetical protein